MITPKEAREKREVRDGAAFKDAVRELEGLLCRPPNGPKGSGMWNFDVPAIRDQGQLKEALVADLLSAGWEVGWDRNRLNISEQREPEAPPLSTEVA